MTDKPKTKQEIMDLLKKFCIENKIILDANYNEQIVIMDIDGWESDPLSAMDIIDRRSFSEELEDLPND